jgi:cbb3-type cytochrome oxidase subunit 1
MEETATIQTPTETSEPIHHSMLVAEINQKFPQCLPVFEKYGIAGCGGKFGPPEPLFIFAAAHRVPLREFVDELNRAVRGEWKAENRDMNVVPTSEKEAVAEAREQFVSENLYKQFVFGALFVALTAGFGLGLVNLTRISLAQSYYEISGVLKQIHGHAQVFGWVGLFVMGVAFHAVPRMKMVALRPVRAAQACLWLMLTGVSLRVLAQPFANSVAVRLGLLGSGLLELASIGLFVGLLAAVMTRSEQKREFHEKFVWAGAGWLLVLGIWNFLIVLQMFRQHSVGIPALQDALWIHVAFFGFIANIIFGFSLRVLPHFLGLRESKTWAANVAFWLWNAAIFLRYPVERLAWAASILEAVAIVLFVWALGIFARRRTKIDIKGIDNAFGWFIKLGYGWLLLVALIPFHSDVFRLSASARHTMAIGFITPLIFGVAYRVLPIFNGVNLWSNRLMRVSFWHLAAGSTLAFAMAFNKVFETTWSYAWSGIAGFLVFVALVMFAINIAMTLRTKAEKFTRDAVVKLTTRITELLEVYPDLRPVLIHGGLSGLATMRHNPPRFVSIEFAARRHNLDPQPLIKILNDEIERRKH